MENPVFSNHLSEALLAFDARLRFLFSSFPANKYMLKFNKRKVTVHQKGVNNQRHYGVFIVTFEHISLLFIVFLLLTLNK